MTDARAQGDGRLVVISGPSGAGKTSVCRALKQDRRVEFSVSATTRSKRSKERDGVDYYFLDGAEFERREAAGEFLENAVYNGHRYGTLRAPMEGALAAGRFFVLEIEVNGTEQLRDGGIDAQYVLIKPPSIDELRRRLVKRGSDTLEVIEQRVAIAARELEREDLYDHIIVNEDLAPAIRAVKEVLGL